MYNINKAACDIQSKGWCNQLEKHPKNYLFAFLLSLSMNYLIPLMVFLLVVLVSGRNDIADYLLFFFSPIFPGIVSLYFGMTSIGIIIIGFVILLLDTCYFIFMIRQLGFYTIFPVLIELAKWIIILFFDQFILIAAILSIIPFMSISVGSHFFGRVKEDGGLITRNA